MRAKHLLSLSLLLLAGCTSIDDPWLTGATETPGTQQNREIPLGNAWGELLGIETAPIAIRQLSGQQGRRQEIVYSNRTTIVGENMLILEKVTRQTAQATRAPSFAELSAEMREMLPGIRMQMNPTVGSNAYGIYGSALGTATDGTPCVYAWQQTGRQANSEPLKVRLRYCATEADAGSLHSLLSSLSLEPGRREDLTNSNAIQAQSELYTYSSPKRDNITTETTRSDQEKARSIQPEPPKDTATVTSVLVPLPQ